MKLDKFTEMLEEHDAAEARADGLLDAIADIVRPIVHVDNERVGSINRVSFWDADTIRVTYDCWDGETCSMFPANILNSDHPANAYRSYLRERNARELDEIAECQRKSELAQLAMLKAKYES